ncbi:hypothetical protein [Ancylobacter sp. IITR112]|uniref:hypothetical protein n=1 Tax=Ancylobacter sp. IITR112 TaxID=3138073 RepID=UPI00352AA9D1
MPDQIFIGAMNGVARLRTVVPGFDAADPSLPERYVTFDSTNIGRLRLVANGVVASNSLPNLTLNYGNGWQRACKWMVNPAANLATPVLAWARRGSGTLTLSSGAFQSFQRGYLTLSVSLTAANMYFSPQLSGVDYLYYLFGNAGSSAEAGGPNGVIFGKHDAYGHGLFISKPGFDVDTCSLDDMPLTTRRNHFQIYETGLASATIGVTAGPFIDYLYNGASIIDLEGSYPHYPPVIVYRMGEPSTGAHTGVFWINPSRILVTGASSGIPSQGIPAVQVRYAVIATDAAYTPGVDSVEGITRCFISPEHGLAVTKHNVDFDSAGENDFIFKSRRLSPYLKGYAQIAGGLSTGVYSLPSPPPTGSGPPFNFFILQDGLNHWWCGCGNHNMTEVLQWNSGIGAYVAAPTTKAWVSSRTTYSWLRPANSGVSVGFHATMNVSDF